MSNEILGLLVILAAIPLTFAVLMFMQHGKAWMSELRHLWHFTVSDTLIDEITAEDIKELYWPYLTKVVPESPFDEKKLPLSIKWVDRLGRTVLMEIRWPGVTYYHLNTHWLDILNKEWPIPTEN